VSARVLPTAVSAGVSRLILKHVFSGSPSSFAAITSIKSAIPALKAAGCDGIFSELSLTLFATRLLFPSDNTTRPFLLTRSSMQCGFSLMKNPTTYLKMRVLGAIDSAEGTSIIARIHNVSAMTFTDEDGHPRQFTWRTIQTWYTRWQKHGITVLGPKLRSDKGHSRKVTPELLAEAITSVLPRVHHGSNGGRTPSRSLVYRLCIESGVLTRAQIAPNTFIRLVNQYELLKPDTDPSNKRRLAFAKAHANELWQADTLYGPHVSTTSGKTQTRLIAFIDETPRASAATASSFWPTTSIPSSMHCVPPFTNAACPTPSTSTTAPTTAQKKLFKFAHGWGHCCITPRCAMGLPKVKSNASFARCGISSCVVNWIYLHSKPSTASSPHGSRKTTTRGCIQCSR